MPRERPGKLTRFSSENQPAKRSPGRPKNVFGPLAKADNLTNEDVKKICKNLLKSDPSELSKVVAKYPTVLTVTLANMLTQEIKGKLTGRMEATGRLLPTGKHDSEGNMIMEPELRPERERSFDTVKYMIDRCFGKPVETGIILSGTISEESEVRIKNIFENTFIESEAIEPDVIAEKMEYLEPDDG
ncbi:MAG: hypothetical protein FWH12_02365 [Treponema sp.]|nr:hypothetical protein [Treponema sp.]